MTINSYEKLINHLVNVHKICRKIYEAQTAPTVSTEPEVIDLDGNEEAVNVTAPEAVGEVVEINPQVN